MPVLRKKEAIEQVAQVRASHGTAAPPLSSALSASCIIDDCASANQASYSNDPVREVLHKKLAFRQVNSSDEPIYDD